MKSKKGIAPLLATLLLVVLASGIGIIVMNFSRAQIEIAAQCAIDVGLGFVVIEEKKQVCYDRPGNQLFFIVENGPQIGVEQLRLRVIGEDEVLVQDIDESAIEKAGALLKYMPYNAMQFGEARQLRLTPIISLYDQMITCAEQSLVIEEISDCEGQQA